MKANIKDLFIKVIKQEHLLYLKTERIKRSFENSFSSNSELINFVKQFFESISSYNKVLETRGFNHYVDPKYKITGNQNRSTQRVLDLKLFNDELRQKYNFPVITFKELHLLSSFYNLNDGDSIYLQEFMFMTIGTQKMFDYFQNVINFLLIIPKFNLKSSLKF